MDDQRNTRLDWQELAVDNPYWAVITDEKWRGSLKSDQKDAFLQTGKEYVAAIQTFASKLNVVLDGSVALDFGCGVGRLAIPMSSLCEEITGVDISQGMLSECNANARRLGITNLRTTDSLETLASTRRQFDWINSFIVFQHIPPSAGMNYLRTLLGMLKVGGFVSLHFTFARQNHTLKVDLDRCDTFAFREKQFVAMDIPDPKPFPKMIMYDYDIHHVILELYKAGCEHIQQQITLYRGHYGVLLTSKSQDNHDNTWIRA